ncbi:MAG: helix-turn-helix transcriptional regulator, partial [Eubacteriales bacterium]
VKDNSNPYIRKALMYIAARYSEPLTISSVAEMLKLSPNHFSALFQKVVGMKFHEYLCRVRVEESKLLLLSSDYSLTDIAVAMGFPDQSYFCKVFKKIVGLPPGQYRSK